MITQKRLKEVVHYDLETGLFKSIIKRKKCPIGKILGTLDPKGYVKIGIEKKLYAAHRLVWLYVYGEQPKHQIDHINGKRNDNRIVNLRDVCSQYNTQNQQKAQKNSSTGYLGVSWSNQKRKFRASIVLNNKQIHIGFFNDKQQASQAYQKTKQKLHKGYVKLELVN